MGPQLAVNVSKCPRLKNVYKCNGRCLKKVQQQREQKRGTIGGPQCTPYTRLCVQGWPYPPRTFFYRDNRSSGVSSLFSAVLGRHSCTKSMGMC